MTDDTIDAYKNYAKHEAHLYSTLQNLSSKGEPLRVAKINIISQRAEAMQKNVIGIISKMILHGRRLVLSISDRSWKQG